MIASRGIPSKEALWLPPYNKVKKFQDENERRTRNLFTLEEVIAFIFPPPYQKRYYEIGLMFIKKLIDNKGFISSDEIASFVNSNNISKATFYNRVLPRMRRAGLIKIEREITQNLDATKKRRKLKVRISRTFGNYLLKIADSWLAIVDEINASSSFLK